MDVLSSPKWSTFSLLCPAPGTVAGFLSPDRHGPGSGPLDAIRWLRRTYGDDMIRDWIIRHRGRQLSSQQVRFWETLIGLPADDVQQWLAEPTRRLWEGSLGQ